MRPIGSVSSVCVLYANVPWAMLIHTFFTWKKKSVNYVVDLDKLINYLETRLLFKIPGFIGN